jgi:hypothetical protein
MGVFNPSSTVGSTRLPDVKAEHLADQRDHAAIV